ncbi:MAG TPA: response regulator [Ktedonobacterales bacterium]|jgi:CheY-like chemotaxis protein
MTQVLVADDSPTVRLSLKRWLEPAGYAVLEASDGPRALEALRTHAEPLIVLLDYQMPGMTGYEVLRAALAERLTPPRRVYAIISGQQSTFPPEFNDLLRELGIQLIPKPFDRETLLMLMDYLSARQGAGA